MLDHVAQMLARDLLEVRLVDPIPKVAITFLDCRVYNLALAEYLGLSSMTPDEWAVLARRHGLPDVEEMIFRGLGPFSANHTAMLDHVAQMLARDLLEVRLNISAFRR
jgi:hypothetical protein